MIFLFKYNIPSKDKLFAYDCDVAVLYLDPANGNTYWDLYIKANGKEQLKIPLKQLAIRAMLDKAKIFAPEVFKKYEAMNNDNWREFIAGIESTMEGIQQQQITNQKR